MSLTQLTIKLTHTGLLPNGRPNRGSVLVNDLETGHAFQLRKVKVYVPVGGSITIPASANSLLSMASGVIKKFVDTGVLTASFYVSPPSYSNATRPLASTVPVGSPIWNTDDAAPNFSDGLAWRDAMGSIT